MTIIIRMLMLIIIVAVVVVMVVVVTTIMTIIHFFIFVCYINSQMANVKSKVKVGLPLLSMQVPRKL
jgi:hypothetical protein